MKPVRLSVRNTPIQINPPLGFGAYCRFIPADGGGEMIGFVPVVLPPLGLTAVCAAIQLHVGGLPAQLTLPAHIFECRMSTQSSVP